MSIQSVKDMLKKNRSANSDSNIEWYRIPKTTDEVCVRVLPHWNTIGEFPIKPVIRYYKIPDGTGQTVNVKSLQTWGMECPIEAVLAEFDGVVDHGFKASLGGHANILVLQDNTQQVAPNKVYVGTLTAGMVNWFVETLEKPENQVLLDPAQGFDLFFKRQRENGKVDIRNAFSPRPIADTPEGIQSILSQMVDLDKVFKQPDDQTVQQMHKYAAVLKQNLESLAIQQGVGTSVSQQMAQPYNPNVQQPPVAQPMQAAPQYQPPMAPAPAPVQAAPQYQQPVPAPQPMQASPAPAPMAPAPAPMPAQAAPAPQPHPLTQPIPAPQPAMAPNPAMTPQPVPAPIAQAAAAPMGGTSPVPKPEGHLGGQQKKNSDSTQTNKSPGSGFAKFEKPPSAPDCYADPSVFNEEDQKCLDCHYELHCSETITANASTQ